MRHPSNEIHGRRPSALLPWLMIGLTMVIFAGAIGFVSRCLRQEVRSQITSRDGEVLSAVAVMLQFEAPLELQLVSSIEEPATQFEVVLRASRIKGVIAARLFDAGGRFVNAFPPNVNEATLPEADLRRLFRLEPVSHFHPNADLDAVLLRLPDPDSARAPLLEVNVPLHAKDQDQLLGVAQFILSGESIAQQFAALDRHLFWQAGVIFATGSILIFFGLRHAFRRLQRSNRLLANRTEELLRANQELLLVAKTSAVGAITSHLIHGLKNPLFGLSNLASQCLEEPPATSEAEWKTAAATTRQMQGMINEVVQVLQDEQQIVASQISIADLVEVIEAKFKKSAIAAGRQFAAASTAHGILSNRVANLLLLILQNLIDNALQATRAGAGVQLDISPSDHGIVLEVRDRGPGIDCDTQRRLFLPCRSAKPNSSGLGLAISKQLAAHLGASLELTRSGPEGSTFTLRLPEEVLAAGYETVSAA